MKNKIFGDLNFNKMLYCSLGFVLFCALLILIFIIPTLKAYQNANLRLNSQNMINRNVSSKLSQSEQRLSQLQNDNKQIFARFDKGLDEKSLNAFLKQFFSEVKLEKMSIMGNFKTAARTSSLKDSGASDESANKDENSGANGGESLENSSQNSGAQKEPYLQGVYQVSAILNDPKNFYAFIDALKNYQNILNINLPINLQAQNTHINIHFTLKVYSSHTP